MQNNLFKVRIFLGYINSKFNRLDLYFVNI